MPSDGEIFHIDGIFSESIASTNSAIPLTAIDDILRTGGNEKNSILRIAVHCLKDFSTEQNTDFIKNEYKKGAKGFEINGEKMSVYFDETGMTIGKGESALQAKEKVFFSWEQAGERIIDLLVDKKFITQDEMEHAFENEFTELAKRLLFLYRDNFRDFREVPGEWKEDSGGFPASVEKLKTILKQSEKLIEITEKLETDIQAAEMEGFPIRRWGNPNEVLKMAKKAQVLPTKLPAVETLQLPKISFITEEEITDFVKSGSSISGGKFRIFSYFLQESEKRERVKFLRDEYGIGGRSHSLFGADDSYENHDSKGVELSRGDISNPSAKLSLSWSALEKRMNDLIHNGLYMSRSEMDALPEYEKKSISGEIRSFYASLPLDIERPFERDVQVRDLIEDKEKVAEILESMKSIFENTHTNDRHYEIRKTAFENVTAYQNGEFTLFPNAELLPTPEYATQQQHTKTNTIEQVSLFPTEQEQVEMIQISEIQENEEAPAKQNEFIEINQTDIDLAVQNWNGNRESKMRVHEYMKENSRARATADFLKEEFGGNLSEFIVTKEGVEPVILPWAKVQRCIAQLINEKKFLLQEEQNLRNTENIKTDSVAESEIEIKENIKINSSNQSEIVPSQPEKSISQSQNFRITNDNLGEGGAKTKFQRNIEAIELLQKIESENRTATAEEQEILSQYVGWGGLAQAFDRNNKAWENEFSKLQTLLTQTEYEAARASTLNAHYTSPTIIKVIYETIERMGFSKGNILEPAMGVGNFFGLLPESMTQSKLYGVELDNITGRIAKQLYPNADIKITGFEKTEIPDNFFDLAIGNVPFGDYKIMDKKYGNHNFNIHDYFFAKSLDQVRSGGVVAFITSKGTMDKQNPEVRKYIAQRAELLGAVRLPNDAFKKNAGTEVTSDILFFQKRDRMIDIEPDWVHLGHDKNDIPLNTYFIENPEMILGTMTFNKMMYGNSKEASCMPFENADLAEQLKIAMQNIQGTISQNEVKIENKIDIESINEAPKQAISASPEVRNHSYTIVDDTVYFRENGEMLPVDMPDLTLERTKSMIAIRDCVHELINYQVHDYSNSEIKSKQVELNTLYDKFSKKFGLLNATANNRAFDGDSSYYLLCSLENLDDEGNFKSKADMFTKRTIKKKSVVTFVDTASEALAISLAEKATVDLRFMSELTGKDKETIINDLQGVIFRNLNKMANDFEKIPFVTADEYLSGNVRQKLEVAEEMVERYPLFAEQLTVNINALKQVQPKELEASEIYVRLGATWIDKKYIEQFMHELIQAPYHLKQSIKVRYSKATDEWKVENANHASGNVLANVTYGTNYYNACKIIEETLNLRDIRIYDTKQTADGEKRVFNKKETTLVQQKQESIKQAFKDWIFNDPKRREELVSLYNKRFNSTRPREYDGSHITFDGMTPEITLQTHQKNAIARILYGGNALLAHEVGAGKTYECIAAAMESKRLGLCQKSLICVPNHLTEQWASEFLKLYPTANILVATKKDFETKNRKKFCGRIATGDYDAVIIGHSQLEKIPISAKRQEELLRNQIYEIVEGIDELSRQNSERFSIKKLENLKRKMETKLAKLLDTSRKDDIVTFEELGVDRLFVDESHAFKELCYRGSFRKGTLQYSATALFAVHSEDCEIIKRGA